MTLIFSVGLVAALPEASVAVAVTLAVDPFCLIAFFSSFFALPESFSFSVWAWPAARLAVASLSSNFFDFASARLPAVLDLRDLDRAAGLHRAALVDGDLDLDLLLVLLFRLPIELEDGRLGIRQGSRRGATARRRHRRLHRQHHRRRHVHGRATRLTGGRMGDGLAVGLGVLTSDVGDVGVGTAVVRVGDPAVLGVVGVGAGVALASLSRRRR